MARRLNELLQPLRLGFTALRGTRATLRLKFDDAASYAIVQSEMRS